MNSKCGAFQCPLMPIMGQHCIRHYYEAKGKPCPTLDEVQRPALDRNTVAMGKQATSRAAAARALPRSGTKRAAIWELLKAHQGLTADEINAMTGISPNTINPTINSLAKDGWIADSGQRRLTRAGNEAIVWVVK